MRAVKIKTEKEEERKKEKEEKKHLRRGDAITSTRKQRDSYADILRWESVHVESLFLLDTTAFGRRLTSALTDTILTYNPRLGHVWPEEKLATGKKKNLIVAGPKAAPTSPFKSTPPPPSRYLLFGGMVSTDIMHFLNQSILK